MIKKPILTPNSFQIIFTICSIFPMILANHPTPSPYYYKPAPIASTYKPLPKPSYKPEPTPSPFYYKPIPKPNPPSEKLPERIYRVDPVNESKPDPEHENETSYKPDPEPAPTYEPEPTTTEKPKLVYKSKVYTQDIV